MSNKRVAIIPARSGSKGLPDKNVLPLCGKPLLVYSVEAALESGLFSQVLVSTDSPRYGVVAQAAGACVSMRPPSLARDDTTTYQVLRDLLERQIPDVDSFALLQPTSPLRHAGHVQEAMALFETAPLKPDFLVSVKRAEMPPSLVCPLDEDGSLRHFDGDYAAYRRQNQTYYSPNGAIYIAKTAAFLRQKHFFGPRGIAYVMGAEDSVDIDSIVDMELAALLMQKRVKSPL